MPQKLHIQKKKSVALTPRTVDTLENQEEPATPAPAGKRKITIHSKKKQRRDPDPIDVGVHENKSATLKVDEQGIRFADEEDVIDASGSVPVELNSSTLKDPVPQIPLEPEKAEATQKVPDPEEVHFKFYCYRCGQKLRVPVSWAHKSTPCGRCSHDLVIPPPLEEDL